MSLITIWILTSVATPNKARQCHVNKFERTHSWKGSGKFKIFTYIVTFVVTYHHKAIYLSKIATSL